MKNIITHDPSETSTKYFACEHPEKIHLGFRRLDKSFRFSVNGNAYLISPGYWWDGASIPKFAWSLIGSPWDDDIYLAALIHDILYATHLYTRQKADQIMLDLLKMCGVGLIKRQMIYRNLRAFGWIAYNAKTQQMLDGAIKHLSIDA